MKTVDRYILRLFLKNLAIILVAILSLYAIIEFIEKVDDFIEYQAAAIYYLLFPLYNLPVMVTNALPMAILLSAFATIGGLSRSNQLTALLGGGLSFARISRPLFLAGLALSGIVLVSNLWLVPWGVRETEYMLETQIKGKRATVRTDHQNLYFRDGERILSFERSFPRKGRVQGVSIIDFDEQFKPVRRIEAVDGLHQQGGVWLFRGVRRWAFSADGRDIAGYDQQAELRMDLRKRPEEMVRLWNVPEEMTMGELYDMIGRAAREGHDPQAYRVEAHLRLARAGVPLIMILLGAPFALQRGRNARFSLGVVISLAIFIVYFMLYALFAALGAAGILPAVVGAWSANILMALTGSWMLLRVQD